MREAAGLHRRLSLIGLGVLVVGAAVLVAGFWMRGSAPSRRIVFQAKVDGLYQLFVIRPDGTGLKQLTHIAMTGSSVPGVEQPHWSPDGKVILFDSDYLRSDQHVISLFTIRSDGTGLKRLPLVTGLFNGEPSWSPDGKDIVFTYDRSNTPAHEQGIEVAQADGEFPYALTRSTYAYQLDQRAAWSPSGNWIAFAESYGPGQSEIMKVRDVSGTPVPLTSRDLNGNNPKWSPDGTKILFNSHNDDPNPSESANLYTVSPTGKHLVQITHYRGGHLDAYADSWSPDGTEILYHLRGSLPNGSEVNQLFIVPARGGPPRQLTNLPVDMNPGYADWH